MFKTIILALLLISQSAQASCLEDIQVLSKGQAAPCDGLLFSPEASKKVDETQEDAKYYKTLSERLQVRQDYTSKEINILDQRLQLYMKESEVLANQLASRENSSKWEKVLYFTLGVVTVGVAAGVASKLAR